jgi:hypothetical protein
LLEWAGNYWLASGSSYSVKLALNSLFIVASTISRKKNIILKVKGGCFTGLVLWGSFWNNCDLSYFSP